MRIASTFHNFEMPLHHALELTRSDLVLDKLAGYCLGTITCPITVASLPIAAIADIVNGIAQMIIPLFSGEFDEAHQHLLFVKAVAFPLQQLLFGVGVAGTAFLVTCFGIVVLGTFEAGIVLTALLWTLLYKNGRFLVSLLPQQLHNSYMTMFIPDAVSLNKLEHLVRKTVKSLNPQDSDVGDQIFRMIHAVVHHACISGGFGKEIQNAADAHNADYWGFISKLDIYLMIRINDPLFKESIATKILDISNNRPKEDVITVMDGEDAYSTNKDREKLMQVFLNKKQPESLPYDREVIYRLIERYANICRTREGFFAAV